MNSILNEERKKDLRSTYVQAPKFGLVLGAGVTANSGVPTYDELALRLLERASHEKGFSGSPGWVRTFVQNQRELLAKKDRKTVPPDEVVLFTRAHLGADEKLLRKLTKQVLYKNVAARRTVGRDAFRNNTTLDAILTFCAARPDTVIAPASKYEIEVNDRIGGILTTNYDNLLEGAFHTKYRRNLLKPVGRPGAREFIRGRRLIPVYHIHGYVGYREPVDLDNLPRTSDVVIAEDDYFEIFYDPLGFGNYIAMSFFRRFPCLFIGSGLGDKNLRRFLFHLTKDIGETATHQRKFAILKSSETVDDEFTDKILLSYGIETIWISKYDEIEGILQNLYTSVGGVKRTDWDFVAGYRWG
ncbi:MAG TPA: SIR2 family protein [Dehalococcoidia bacterium]|nr:SIR2 family protein [Dehalococcoidia bacterium]